MPQEDQNDPLLVLIPVLLLVLVHIPSLLLGQKNKAINEPEA